MNDAMIDLETFGTKPGCAIRSIGAVQFDPHTGEIGETFYRNVEDRSCWLAGLRLEPATARWWDGQSADAKKAFEIDQTPLREVVGDFNTWYLRLRIERVWCHGAGFDAPIYETCARVAGESAPWKYPNIRCTRTTYALAGVSLNDVPREGVAHNALADARHQVKVLHLAFRRLALLKQEAA